MTQLAQTDNIRYFQTLAKGLKDPHNFQSKGKSLADFVEQKMSQKILISQVTLPAEVGTKKLIIPKKLIQPPQQTEQDLLKKVENEKMALLEKMKDLSKQEDELKYKIKANFTRQKIIYQPHIPQDQQQKFRQLIRQSRRFQKSLKKKDQELSELYREKSREEIRHSQQLNEQRRERKRQRAIESLKSLEAKSAERKLTHEQSIKKLKELQHQEYLYLKNAEKDEQKMAQKQHQYYRKLQQIREGLKLNIQQIKEHEKKYEEHLEASRLKMEEKSMEKSKHRHSKSYADNYFSVITKARIQQERVQSYEKLNQGHIFKERICKFQQKISTEFKPKVSDKSKFTPLKQSLSVHALSNVQQRQKGIEYLQQAKKLIDAEKEKQRRMTHASPVVKPSYKDYTKQLKYKGYETAESKFNSLVRQRNSLSGYDNVSKAVQLAVQIQAKSKLTNDQKLLSSVKNKIELLNALQ